MEDISPDSFDAIVADIDLTEFEVVERLKELEIKTIAIRSKITELVESSGLEINQYQVVGMFFEESVYISEQAAVESDPRGELINAGVAFVIPSAEYPSNPIIEVLASQRRYEQGAIAVESFNLSITDENNVVYRFGQNIQNKDWLENTINTADDEFYQKFCRGNSFLISIVEDNVIKEEISDSDVIVVDDFARENRERITAMDEIDFDLEGLEFANRWIENAITAKYQGNSLRMVVFDHGA